MGLRLFVLFIFFSATNVAYAEGIVNVYEPPSASEYAEPAPAPAPEASAPVVQVFSQLDSTPTESQQYAPPPQAPDSNAYPPAVNADIPSSPQY